MRAESPDKPIVERAFELAASGRFASISDLRKTLLGEGYAYAEIAQHLGGRGIQKTLQDRIAASWKLSRG